MLLPQFFKYQKKPSKELVYKNMVQTHIFYINNYSNHGKSDIEVFLTHIYLKTTHNTYILPDKDQH